MQNILIIIRFILFSLMIFMNVLTLIFASWNVGVTVSSGFPAPGASVFLILNSCAIFMFIAAALAELVLPKAKTANVAFECGWTAVFSVLQLGAAVAATVNGPPAMCQPRAPWAMCASSHVLVPVSWLSSFSVLAYFFLLFGTTVAHVRANPLIWWSTVYSVPWFTSPPTLTVTDMSQQGVPSQTSHAKKPSNSSRESFVVFRYLHDRVSTRMDDEESQISEPILFPERSNGLQPAPRPPSGHRPAWAREASGRRGLDAPFGKRAETPSTENESTAVRFEGKGRAGLATPQPQMAPMRRGIDQPFTRKPSGPAVPVAAYMAHPTNLHVPQFDTRPILPIQRKRTVSPVFSDRMHDQDSPIPLPQRSEWIKADSQRSVAPPRLKGR